MESENEDETGNSENGGSSAAATKPNESEVKATPGKSKKGEKKIKQGGGSISDSSDTEAGEEAFRRKKMEALLVMASRHSKVFFENENGDIFSIYRCLLHNKKVSV